MTGDQFKVGDILPAVDERGVVIGGWVCTEGGEFGKWEWIDKPAGGSSTS